MPSSSQIKNQHLLWRAGFGIDVNFLAKIKKMKHLLLVQKQMMTNKWA